MVTNLDEFIKRVDGLHEVEYGDFKRKVGQYITRLEQSLGPKKNDPEIKKILRDMKNKIVYQPRPDIESARIEALTLARAIRSYFQ